MKKKEFTIFLVSVATVLLAACGSSQTSDNLPTEVPTPSTVLAPTETVTPTLTPELTEAATVTPAPSNTATPEPTATSTPMPSPTQEPTATSTPSPTPEPTATSTPSPTPLPTPTPSPVPTATPKPTPSPTPTPELCPYEMYTWYDMGSYKFFLIKDYAEVQNYQQYMTSGNYEAIKDINPALAEFELKHTEKEVYLASTDTKWKNHAIFYSVYPREVDCFVFQNAPPTPTPTPADTPSDTYYLGTDTYKYGVTYVNVCGHNLTGEEVLSPSQGKFPYPLNVLIDNEDGTYCIYTVSNHGGYKDAKYISFEPSDPFQMVYGWSWLYTIEMEGGSSWNSCVGGYDEGCIHKWNLYKK